MSAELLLSRLDGVKDRGHGRWIAQCPAHDDRSPSLSIKETDDGTVLLKCWAGCGAADIVGAVGLTLSDLFPRRNDHHQAPIRKRDRWNPRDVIGLVLREAAVILIAANDIRDGLKLSDEDHQRLVQACGRISALVEEVGI
jgi:hypothetical protein